MSRKIKNHHLLPIASSLLVFVGIIILVSNPIRWNIWEISVMTYGYFFANVFYGLFKKNLTVKKIIEVGILAAIVLIVAGTNLV